MFGPCEPDAALAWAAEHRAIRRAALIRRSPWGITLRLDAQPGPCFLKCLPPAQAAAAATTAAISALLGDAVSRVLAVDAERGLLLSADHGGHAIAPDAPVEERQAVLQAYARLQAVAVAGLDRLSAVPRWSLSELLARVDRFLGGRFDDPQADTVARLADFLGPRRAGLIGDALAAARTPLRARLEACDALPLTLEHGDLHLSNVAVLADGQRVFHDWDNALIGPVGLSLSSLIGPATALTDGLHDRDESSFLAACYAECLASEGVAPLVSIRAGLPAAVLAGLLVRLTAYAQYPPHDDASREVCVPDLVAISDAILAWCARLALPHPLASSAIIHLLAAHQREDLLLDLARERGAEALLGAAGGTLAGDAGDAGDVGNGAGETLMARRPATALAVARWAQAEAAARAPGTVPALSVDGAARQDDSLLTIAADVGSGMLAEHGCLALQEAFPARLLAACLAHHGAQPPGSQEGLPVGDQRVMHPLPLAGPFNTPALYAQPLVLRLMSSLLGPDFLIGSITLVVSRPGASAQHLHADHPPLYPHAAGGAWLPPHAVTLLVPLVATDDEVGGTELFKGSHRGGGDPHGLQGGQTHPLPLGGGLLFDYRLLHRGLANRSGRDRPVLSIVYQRSWFRDAVNFSRFPPLQMGFEELKRVPAPLSGLFRLVHLTHD